LPSDIVFAYAWLLAICNEFEFEPGKVKMDFGDCHIYEEHLEGAQAYIKAVAEASTLPPVLYEYLELPGTDFCLFEPSNISFGPYKHKPAINFELKA